MAYNMKKLHLPKPKTIVIDFDGTCVAHEFPKIGFDIGAQPVLKELTDLGHKLVLFTMRSNRGSDLYLDEAVQWFHDNEIPLYGVQTNPSQKRWTTSPKAHGNLFIDDLGLGIPLTNYYRTTKHEWFSPRHFVNWSEVRELLVELKYLPNDKQDTILINPIAEITPIEGEFKPNRSIKDRYS